VFAAVLFLYSAPLDAVLYATLLCVCLGALAAGIGFLRYCRRHELLREQLERVAYSISELPAPKECLETDYLELIKRLFDEKNSMETDFNATKSDLNDYYTMWAHQIKTPIAAMSLILQSSNELDSDARAEMSEELFKIEQYVGMALSYLRLESPSTDYVLKKYELDGIVKQAVRKYAKIFIRKKIALRLESLDTEILTDEKWLAYAIEQVLSNALKYTPDGGEISVYTVGKTLVIEDNGIGIEKEDLPRVFEKGFTGYNGRIEKKSTGIGLYLCRRVLEKLSHTVEIESEAGKGTRVKIGLGRQDAMIE
jgi:signal transduction histidine kinase